MTTPRNSSPPPLRSPHEQFRGDPGAGADPSEHLDVLIIGAGLSGIGAAAQLTREHPGRSYAILEAREAMGGTWDLFRYPGIRSDSDMFTMGYRFRPWRSDVALADGPSILAYIQDTAREYRVDEHVRYDHRVTSVSWDSARALWTVTAQTVDGPVELTASFVWACSGYYDYDTPYTPELPGIDQYAGRVVHPQHWPDDLDPTGQRFVVIGSGATAITLVPSLAERGAEHVTMLQRSPTYVVSVPGSDGTVSLFRRWLPEKSAYLAARVKAIATHQLFFKFCKRFPDLAKRLIVGGVAKQLPEGYPVGQHFTPTYDPWDQRVCAVPQGDLFRAIRRGSVDVVTDTIDTFTEKGVRLRNGDELMADVVVTATGFNLQLFGDAEVVVDGEVQDLSRATAYRALMLSGLPNFAFTIGYTNASWTLKADLVGEFVCRVLSHLDETGARSVVPVPPRDVGEAPFMDFTPGYVLRSLHVLPKQGTREPWRMKQSYVHDLRTIRRAPLDDGSLVFR